MVKLAENAGFGFDKIETNWMDYNKTKPIYDLSFDSTIVKFFLAIPEDISEKTSEKASEKTSEKILDLIRNNNEITTQEMAETLNRTTRAIELAIAKLKKNGQLERIGPDKGGEWKVLE